MTTSIGRLRHRVTLQQDTGTKNANHEIVPTWTDVASIYCAVKGVSGVEAIQGMQLDATTTHLVEMRYRSDVQPRMRLLWGSRVLNISSVVDLKDRQRRLFLQCVEDV
jgi:SPP1 family predicted phage head-tail adaptor